MKQALLMVITGLALALTISTACAQSCRGPQCQLTINAGSGLIFNSSVVNNQYQPSNNRGNNRPGHERPDHGRPVTIQPVYNGVSTSGISSGVYQPEYDVNAVSSYKEEWQREGEYLKDRYDNCFRIKEGRHNDTKIRVKKSRCRF